jgi:hypothetical protein
MRAKPRQIVFNQSLVPFGKDEGGEDDVEAGMGIHNLPEATTFCYQLLQSLSANNEVRMGSCQLREKPEDAQLQSRCRSRSHA